MPIKILCGLFEESSLKAGRENPDLPFAILQKQIYLQ